MYSIAYAIFSLVLLQVQPTKARMIEADNLGNLYLVYNDRIEKLDSTGKLIYRTAELAYGAVHSLDVTDPLKPFIFFRDASVIYPMDNTLSLQGDPIMLNNLNLGLVECAARSRGNQYWLWDASRGQLMRINRQTEQTGAAIQVNNILGDNLQPRQIVESGSRVYLLTSNEILVFDLFGNYLSRTPVSHSGAFRTTNDFIVFNTTTTLHLLSRDFLNEVLIDLPVEAASPVAIRSDKIYYLGSESLVSCRLLRQ